VEGQWKSGSNYDGYGDWFLDMFDIFVTGKVGPFSPKGAFCRSKWHCKRQLHILCSHFKDYEIWNKSNFNQAFSEADTTSGTGTVIEGQRRFGYGGQRKPGGINSGMAQGKGGPPSSQFIVESDYNQADWFLDMFDIFIVPKAGHNKNLDKLLRFCITKDQCMTFMTDVCQYF
jgi:hypothetical protein